MATSGNQIRQTFEAGADLSAKKDTFVIVTNAAERTVNTPAAGAKVDGVLLNDPRAAGHAAAVAVFGRVKVVAGAAIALGAEIQTDAQGRAITATGTNIRLGKTTEAATAAGQLITIDFYPGGNAA